MRDYAEADWLDLSRLNAFLWCRRRFALSVIECQYAENAYTVSGTDLHRNVHDPDADMVRNGVIHVHGLRVFHPGLGVSGECDLVEFMPDPDGVTLDGRIGRYRPVPVEYKRGRVGGEKPNDRAQLCCQSMCLEHMLACDIEYGFLYYFGSRRRIRVDFDPALRKLVTDSLGEMHDLVRRRYTPVVRPKAVCRQCSLYEACMPALSRPKPVGPYMREGL